MLRTDGSWVVAKKRLHGELGPYLHFLVLIARQEEVTGAAASAAAGWVWVWLLLRDLP